MELSDINAVPMRRKISRTGFLGREDLRGLHKDRALSWCYLAAQYGAILGSIALVWLVFQGDWHLYYLPCPIVAFLIIGWAQFSISHGLHEAVHKNLGENQNDLIAGLLTAWPIGFTMSYRDIHLDHHRYFGNGSKDPDFAGYSDFPRSKRQLLTRILFNGSGVPAIWQFFFQRSPSKSPAASRNWKMEMVGLIIVQFSIFAALGTFIGWFAYPLFWVLPIITLGKMFSSTRLLCEHGSPDGIPVIRTILGTPSETKTLGAFNFHYHGEHHIYPTVPFAGLPKLFEHHQSAFGDASVRTNPEISYEIFNGGYLKLLAYWFSILPLNIEGKGGS